MLSWLYGQGEALQDSVVVTDFLRHPRSVIDGHFVSPTDLDTAAAYLQAKGLIDGLIVDGQRGPVRAWLTAAGIDYVEQRGVVTDHGKPRHYAINSLGVVSQTGNTTGMNDTKSKTVMVIYGHDKEANEALFNWLRAIGLKPQEWNQLIQLSGNASPYIGEVLDQAFDNAQAVVAFFTPDEYVVDRKGASADNAAWRLQARPNVLIEAGMALITHPKQTVLVMLGPQELPTDLAGRHYIRLNRTAGPLNDLANRLRHAGCDVELNGADWLDPSRFPERDNTPPHPSLTT